MTASKPADYSQDVDRFTHAYLVGNPDVARSTTEALKQHDLAGEVDYADELEAAVDKIIEVLIQSSVIEIRMEGEVLDLKEVNPACRIQSLLPLFFKPGEYDFPAPETEEGQQAQRKRRESVGEIGFAILRIAQRVLYERDETHEVRVPHEVCYPWPEGHPIPKVAETSQLEEVQRIGALLNDEERGTMAFTFAWDFANVAKEIAKLSPIGSVVPQYFANRILDLEPPAIDDLT